MIILKYMYNNVIYCSCYWTFLYIYMFMDIWWTDKCMKYKPISAFSVVSKCCVYLAMSKIDLRPSPIS
jgi:hypothetical protein